MIAVEDTHVIHQKTLKRLMADNRYRNITPIPTMYNGKAAIRLQDWKTREMVGWIPKDLVSEYVQCKKLIGVIQHLPDSNHYLMRFYLPQPPSRKQYHYMKALCLKQDRPMPFYDRRAYREFFAQLRK